jgi:sec-independent protein translocase protein TatC
MRSPNAAREESDDLFAGTRMSFGDHIEELRLRLVRAILGFLVAMVIGLIVGKYVLDFIQAPVQSQLDAFYRERVATQEQKLTEKMQADQGPVDDASKAKATQLHVKIEFEGERERQATLTIDPDNVNLFVLKSQEFERRISRPASLTSLTITEAFFTYFQVSILCGFVLASPWIFYQLWMFVAAGLYPHEKRYVYLYLPFSLFLFLGGVLLCEFIALPIAVKYLLGFNEWLGVEPELRLSEWLSFAILMPVIFGVAFQTPIVMFFLERMGIVRVELFTKHRRIAILLLAIAAAVLAPAGDLGSMMLLAIPMVGLYEIGILMCRYIPKPPQEIEEPDPEEMVEV